MCTSIVVNKGKTIVGFNLDILGMEYRVHPTEEGVFIEINDEKEGWMPLFGANSRGDFIGMPTCWPFDNRSDPKTSRETNVINLDIDLLLKKRTFEETRSFAEYNPVCSVPGATFMSALSDKNGNVLYIVPGQGIQYHEKPEYRVMTNFSPFKMNSEEHPWMGWDRYQKAKEMIEAKDAFGVDDCFEVLKEVSQTVCPTVVSMVLDVSERAVFWCENRNWENRKEKKLQEDDKGYVNLRERPDLLNEAAEWFHEKWGVKKEAYLKCMEAYLNRDNEYGWYLCLNDKKIIGGLGVIENDFHERKDLSQTICAVYVDEGYRRKGIAGKLLDMAVEDMRKKGISPLYLLTDHTDFYERYGWRFLCMVQGEGEDEPSRMYVHD